MRVKILLILVLLFGGCVSHVADGHLTIYMIGDSTMANKPTDDNPERGWGQLLPEFFTSSVVIDNHAKNGRSTRSFLAESLWQPVVNKLKEGDYVIIQFGHNDQSKEKVDRYTPPEDFKKNLVKFVTETREKKALPILCTPIMRRRFYDSGKFYDTHGVYPDLVREVAADLHVPLLEMHRKSEKLIVDAGEEGSKKIFLWVEQGKYKSLPDGKQDNTHFSQYGATQMAALAVEGMKELNLDLVRYLKK
jgi:DNA sulfur modification protein DndE